MQEQCVLDYRGWFVIPNIPKRVQLFINTFTFFVYDVAYDMDDNIFVSVLEIFVNITLL